MKRKLNLISKFQASTNHLFDDSWEEQAFAEDAAGPLGGCIWPPRSYSCSFCRREFRSAQALGGHMNVHRRDRARLKQPPSAHNEILSQEHQNSHNQLQNPYTSVGFQCPTQVCTLVYSPIPNSDPAVVAFPTSSSRSLTKPPQENCLSPSFSSFIVEEQQKRSSPPSRTKLDTERYYHVSSLSTKGEEKSRTGEEGNRTKVNHVRDFSVSLNLVVRRTRLSISDSEEESINCKKHRIDRSSLASFVKQSSVERHHVQSDLLNNSPCTAEELDLELRLGDRPKTSANHLFDDSWEEQAFAEDAAGPLGGCIWPPRSYSCSFCRREFRSAQALGGHMNVHRRDKAILKQSPSSQNDILSQEHQNSHNHLQNPYTSVGFQYPTQVCTLVYSPNPNSDPAIVAFPTSSSRNSTQLHQENCNEKAFPPSFSDLSTKGEEKSRTGETGNYVRDFSVSLNLVVRRTRPSISDSEEEPINCKKHRIDRSSLTSFVKQSSVERHHVQYSDLLNNSPCTVEELDLELRLGDRPKVKYLQNQ